MLNIERDKILLNELGQVKWELITMESMRLKLKVLVQKDKLFG